MKHSASRGEKDLIVWRLLYFLWFLRLFRPERLISEHIHALTAIRSAPTILLIILIAIWLFSHNKKYKYKEFALFIFALFVSSIFSENHTRAMWAFRAITELYFLAGITFTYADDITKVRKLLSLYFLYIVYFGLWGIPGMGRVEWDYILNEEDAYGPLMTMGIAFGYYYYRMSVSFNKKKYVQLGIIICVIGVVVSFARGAFLVMLCLFLIIFIKEKGKFKNIVLAAMAGIIVIIAANIIFPNNAFWTEMNTISEGTSEGTGADRKILWKVAWYEFIDHPIIGVGPYNFGVVAPDYVIKMPDRQRYLDPGTIWGRSLHNGYFQILCELGIVGTAVFLVLLYDLNRSNRKIMKYQTDENSKDIEAELAIYRQLSSGVALTIFAFLMNAFFYDMIFYTWFWELIIFNRLLLVRVTNIVKQETDNTAKKTKRIKRNMVMNAQ